MTPISRPPSKNVPRKLRTTTPVGSPVRALNRNSRYKQRRILKTTSSLIMYLSKSEKAFLTSFTILSLISLICTGGAIFFDKHAITGTDESPSTCMLSETHDCRTAFRSDVARQIVAVCVRVDVFFSCIAFVTGVILMSFKIFNFRLLIGFLATAMLKLSFIFIAVVIITVNSDYYYSALEDALAGFCGDQLCINEERMNVAVAYMLLLLSGLAVGCIVVTIFTIGSHIIEMYEDSHYEATCARWNEIVHGNPPI